MASTKYVTKSMRYAAAYTYVNKIGLHHFAHLRALAEGIDPIKSALLYLGVEHGNQARAASIQTIDAVRAIARRRGDRSWRLIGMAIKLKAPTLQPSLDDFIAERGLDDWSEDEVGLMYEEAFPSDPKATHRAALREKIIKLLFDIADAAAETPKTTDMVSGWYDEITSTKLISAGILNLGDLQAKIALGGRWYNALPAIGKGKAIRIAQHLDLLLAPSPASTTATFVLDGMDARLLTSSRANVKTRASHFTTDTPEVNEGDSDANIHASGMQLVVSNTSTELLDSSTNDLPTEQLSTTMIVANSDIQAAIAWVQARAGSGFTAITYYREATRLLLWLKYERNGATFARMKVEDCLAYLNFLQHIPTKWMSRKFAAPFSPGWAPFRGQLKQDSFRQTTIIISSMFSWLRDADWIRGNPWVLVNKKTGIRKQKNALDTKAISSESMHLIIEFLASCDYSKSLMRFKFIFIFLTCTGLRSAELLSAKIKDFHLEEDGWMLTVVGKGEKERSVAIPDSAFKAVEYYLNDRGNSGIEYSTSELPLICQLEDTTLPIVYETLYKHVKAWLAKSILKANLRASEKAKLRDVTTHWLRHTFGTMAVEKGVPHDVIKDQMGHSSIEMVARLYGKAPFKRINTEMAKAFG